ncbi:MAG TPA: hypothetical protein VIH36_15210 [Casimicrobiaceae bacterium]|jgi:hypothetical protein
MVQGEFLRRAKVRTYFCAVRLPENRWPQLANEHAIFSGNGYTATKLMRGVARNAGDPAARDACIGALHNSEEITNSGIDGNPAANRESRQPKAASASAGHGIHHPTGRKEG